MKNWLFGLTLGICLSAVVPGHAAVQEFGGPEGFRFMLDVPAGWLVQTQDFGVRISNAAHDASLTVVMAPTTYTDVKTLANELAVELGCADPVLEQKDEESWRISGMIKGAAADTLVRLEEGKMTCISSTGSDRAGLRKIIDTLVEK